MPDTANAGGFRYAADTHPGRLRGHNEDRFAVRADLGLVVVADGMGGHEAGEVASRIATDRIVGAVEAGRPLDEALEEAHTAILEAAGAGVGRPGMGCTAVCARLKGSAYEIAWVGDSRAYTFGRHLRRVTRDHSVVQELVDEGRLSEADARVHPQRSVITRALGMMDSRTVAVSHVSGRLRPGRALLLCTDGLTDEIEDTRIAEHLSETGDPDGRVDGLIRAVLETTARDNVTVAVVQAPARGRSFVRRILSGAGRSGSAVSPK